MANEVADKSNGVASSVSHDLKSILSSSQRDFLVRNDGDQIKIFDLSDKIIGLYFSASWCPPCRRFTPKLTEVYNELSVKNGLEIIFVSADTDDQSFNEYFSKMPWLAIPFSDSENRDRLNELFEVNGIPCLVILDGNGKVLSADAVGIIRDYGVDGHPFTPERVQALKEEEEKAKREQTLRSILVSSSRNFLISKDGNQVLVSELEGKTVGLYFSSSSYTPCNDFTSKLVEAYKKLKENGESFEVVLISLDDDEDVFRQGLVGTPWLALPFKDKICEKLPRYFQLSAIPTLVIIGPDGKTLHPNVAELVDEFGTQAYPFTPEKLAEIEEIKKARLEGQTLESLLVLGDQDFVIGKDGAQVPVSELVGKNILLYFSAHWCPPCRAFLPRLIEAYHEIKVKDDAFEVIFISSDKDQTAFDEFFSGMPWLALPFGDERKKSLSRTFKIRGIPTVIALGPTGRTITNDARELLMAHGADAYPFTEERMTELEAIIEEMARGWPEKVKHALHQEHELVLTRRLSYVCDGCEEEGNGWSFYCEECEYDLHPKCALEEKKGPKDDVKEENGEDGPEQDSKKEIICDGEVCYKA